MILKGRHWGRDLQNESKNRIILLHGMGGTGSLWRPVAAALEDDFNILAPDQRGHGESRILDGIKIQNSKSYTPLDYGQDVVDTMSSLGFHPAWLVGHSMGVRTAVAAAFLKPQWTKGLVLVDLGFAGAAGGGLSENLAYFLKLLPTSFSTKSEARKFMMKHAPDPSIGQYLMAVLVTHSETGQVTFPFDHSALIKTIHSAQEGSIREKVQNIAKKGIPILILRGEKSQVWSHEEFQEEAQRLVSYPNVKFEEFQNTGHGLPFDQKSKFISRLRSFFQI